VVVARSEDVRLDANAVVAALTAKFGGRGGGKPSLAQAGGLDADPSTILSTGLPSLE
jgi:alanyl-tRNA synthetase